MDRILVIDDDVELCSLVGEYLAPEGFQVESAADGNRGLEQALNGVDGLDDMRSKSVPGLSSVLLIFKPGTDLIAARQLVQERLTTQIVEALVTHLKPRGAIVVVECEHMCMSMRGIRKPGAKTVTSAVRGQLHDPATRAEAMSLILGR